MKNRTANDLIDMIDSLSEPDVHDSRWERVVSIAEGLGASSLVMGAINVNSNVPFWLRSSMRSDFLQDYFQQDFVKPDPFVQHCKFSNDPITVIAEGPEQSEGSNRNASKRRRLLRDHSYGLVVGVGSAGTSPGLRRGVAFCFDADVVRTESDNSKFLSQAKLYAAVMTAYVEAPHTFSLPGIVYPRIQELSERERDMLSYLALGMKNDRIAERSGLAEVTVRKHMKTARLKLGASTREQALAMAIKLGLITV